jgi:F5/8 type C domain
MVENAEVSRPPRRGVWQWFWRGSELAQARQALRDVPADTRASLKRAEAALELADRAVNPVDPLRAGPSLPLSFSLYREAAYWALAAQDSTATPLDLKEAFGLTPPDVLVHSAGGEAGLAVVQAALLTKTFRETAEDTLEQQKRDAQEAHAFVEHLVTRQLGPERRVGRALVQRSVRSCLGALLLIGVSVTVVTLVIAATTGPDLAAGKPWHVSSTNPSVPKASDHEYLFHTEEEENPWFEIDLKAPTQFAKVEVTNRRDCCPERAAPAIIEVSDDQKRWKEVSRRADSYSKWTAKFAPVTARYVRIRVPRRSTLHLASVAVRAH